MSVSLIPSQSQPRDVGSGAGTGGDAGAPASSSRAAATAGRTAAPGVRPDIVSAIGGTPLIALDRLFAGAPFRVFGKVERFNPGLTPLVSGTVLVSGGMGGLNSASAASELFTP